MTDQEEKSPADGVEIIGKIEAHYVKVDEPEPGFLVQLKGQTTTMSAFMTDANMAKLIEWCAAALKPAVAS